MQLSREMDGSHKSIAALSEDLAQLQNVELFWDRIVNELANFGITSICY